MRSCVTTSQVSSVAHREISNSIHRINRKNWESVVAGRNVYLSFDYLSGLEDAMKDSMDFFYVISYGSDDKPVLVSSFQLVKFEDKRRKYSEHLCKLNYHLHKKIADAFTINVLVCGNVFCDGENGFCWSDELTPEEAVDEAGQAVEALKLQEEIKEKASVTLFKEFWPSSTIFSDQLKQQNYRDFMIDVNMVLKIHQNWNSMNDYLDSMKSKFRTRAKGAFKKSAELELRTLSGDDIRNESERVEELFGNVLEKSEFSFGRLNVEAFANFADRLKDRFTFRALYLEDRMIGFSTSFFNGASLEANFVGLDYELNSKKAVYQRILYDYVEQALKRKASDLQLGRTAELMKSQVGALPTNMKLYVKHRKSVPNLLLKPIIQSISPSEFELRKPFKANFSN